MPLQLWSTRILKRSLSKMCDYTDAFYHQVEHDGRMDAYLLWQECEACPFRSQSELVCHQHMNTLGHWRCSTCGKNFESQNAAYQHVRDKILRAPEVPCETCDGMLYTQAAADEDMVALEHKDRYCKECNRKFEYQNSLRMVKSFRH